MLNKTYFYAYVADGVINLASASLTKEVTQHYAEMAKIAHPEKEIEIWGFDCAPGAYIGKVENPEKREE